MLQVDLKSLKLYNTFFEFVLLKPNTKEPYTKDFEQSKISFEKLEEKLKEDNYNAAVVIPEDVIVIDVDPRNFPENAVLSVRKSESITDDIIKNYAWETYNDFLHKTKLIEIIDLCPIVKTGNGGFHIYVKHGSHVLETRDRGKHIGIGGDLYEYEGIEIKTIEHGVIVACGSVHPSGRHYEFKGIPDFRGMPTLSKEIYNNLKTSNTQNFLSVIKGDEKKIDEHYMTEIAKLLSSLNPVNFRSFKKWKNLFSAYFRSSDKSDFARDYFLEWAAKDVKYNTEKDFKDNFVHWENLKNRSLNTSFALQNYLAIVREYNPNAVTPRITDGDLSFSDYIVPPNSFVATYMGEKGEFDVIEQLIDMWAKIGAGWVRKDFSGNNFAGIIKTTWTPSFLSSSSFSHQNAGEIYVLDVANTRRLLAGEEVKHAKGMLVKEVGGIKKIYKSVSLDTFIRRHPMTKTYNNIRLLTDDPNSLDVWQGLTVDQDPSYECPLMYEYLKDVICNGDEKSYEYLMKWLAYLFQKPAELQRTALVLYGKKGTGKSFLGHLMSFYFHGYYEKVSKGLLAGDFTIDIGAKKLFIMDETSRIEDETAEKLKSFITDTTIASNRKFKDNETLRNKSAFMIFTNHIDAIPLDFTGRDRRFFMLEVSQKHMNEEDFFTALMKEFENGGAKRFIYDMLRYDYGDFEHNRLPPITNLTERCLEARLTPSMRSFVILIIASNKVGDYEWCDDNTCVIPLKELDNHFFKNTQKRIGAADGTAGFENVFTKIYGGQLNFTAKATDEEDSLGGLFDSGFSSSTQIMVELPPRNDVLDKIFELLPSRRPVTTEG